MAFQKKLTPAYKAQHLNLLVYGTAAAALLGTVDWAEFDSVRVSGWALLVFLGINTLVAYGSLLSQGQIEKTERQKRRRNETRRWCRPKNH